MPIGPLFIDGIDVGPLVSGSIIARNSSRFGLSRHRLLRCPFTPPAEIAREDALTATCFGVTLDYRRCLLGSP
jgi:hypothetical protein